MINLLQHFISARAPCGQEDELRDLLLKKGTHCHLIKLVY